MKEFWSIETVEGVMVEGLYDQVLDEESDEGPDNPRVFSSIKFTTWGGNWDDPKIYKTREDAQKDLNMIPESIRRALGIIEWTGVLVEPGARPYEGLDNPTANLKE